MTTTTTVESESRAARRKRMIAEMSNGRTFFWVGIALLIHIGLIGATSLGYIREHWLHAKVTRDESNPEEKQAAPDAANPPATPAGKAAPTPAQQAPVAGLTDDDKKMAEIKNTPMGKSITEAAKPSELPKTPTLNPLEGVDNLK